MLSQEQVEELTNVSDSAAVYSRMLIATHKFDLDYLADFSRQEPGAFDVILDHAPLAISKAREVARLLIEAEERLKSAKERSTVLM